MKKTKYVPRIIRFRKWSRKAYATFASIGKCVTIGHVGKSIADNSLAKCKKAISQEANEQSIHIDASHRAASQIWTETDWDILEIILKSILSPIFAPQQATIEYSHRYISKEYTYRHALPEISSIRKCMPVLLKTQLL